MRLAETQASIHSAIVADTGAVPDTRPAHRLAIHRRHHRASLLNALTTKFPATVWLMGSAAFIDAADAFVRTHPPAAPCIAEYGENFPDFVAALPISDRAPYLAAVARADWYLGQVSIAVTAEAIALDALASVPPEALGDVRLELQSGLRFLYADWPIDSLIAVHLDGNPPAEFVLERSAVSLQFRGARGAFGIERLEPAVFAFRRALADGVPLGEAAELGLAESAEFDAGQALVSLFAAGLVTGAAQKAKGGFS